MFVLFICCSLTHCIILHVALVRLTLLTYLLYKKNLQTCLRLFCIFAGEGCTEAYGWLRGAVVEHWSLTVELYLSCARPTSYHNHHRLAMAPLNRCSVAPYSDTV